MVMTILSWSKICVPYTYDIDSSRTVKIAIALSLRNSVWQYGLNRLDDLCYLQKKSSLGFIVGSQACCH